MTYRDRRLARVERLREWAQKRTARAEAAGDQARATADLIPFGQPILVGHHSERRHRSDLERIDRGFQQAHEHRQKAEEFERRAGNIAAAVAGSIYRDDPDAAQALERRIGELEAERDRIKAFNASARKGAPDESVLNDRERETLASTRRVLPQALGKNGSFPAYHLSNLNGAISKNRQRLEALRRPEPDPQPEPPAAAPAPADEDRGEDGYTDEEREALNAPPAGHHAHLPGSLWPAIRKEVGGIRITNKATGRKDYDREDIPGGLARVNKEADYPDWLGLKLAPLFGDQAADWTADEALEHLRREYDAFKELPTKVRARLTHRELTAEQKAAAFQHRHLLKLDEAINRERQRHRLRHAARRRAIAFYTDEDGIVHPITVAA